MLVYYIMLYYIIGACAETYIFIRVVAEQTEAQPRY